MDKEKTPMMKMRKAKHVTFSKRKKGIFKKAEELSILCDAKIAVLIISASGKLFCYSSERMEEILERYNLHLKNLEGPSCSEWQPVEGEQAMLSKEVAQKISPLRKMIGEVLENKNVEEVKQLEKSLEGAISRLQVKKAEEITKEIEFLQQKGKELMEENNQLRHEVKVMEMSRGGKLIPADLENIIRDDGPSLESVTNSSRLPRNLERADTTLKLGLNYGGFKP